MSRTLLIDGSPHAQGTTAALIDACLDGVGATTLWRYGCYAAPPLPCDACGFCRTANGCRHTDLEAFYAELEAADLLIFAAPVYNRGFPAPMKALLDRLQRYWSARFVRGVKPPIAHPKQAILLTSGGSGRGDGAQLALQLAPILTILNSAPAIAVHADNTDRAPLSPALLSAARAAGVTAHALCTAAADTGG